MIQGKPWLTEINPDIDWTTNTITAPFYCQESSSTIPTPVIHLITTKRLCKALRDPGNVGFMATIKEIQENSSPPPDPFRPTNTAFSPDYVTKLYDLLDRLRSTFDSPSGVNHQLPYNRIDLLSDATPPVKRTYRMSPAELQQVSKQLQEYLDKGWIRPSTSQFGAPILFVRKKDGSLRMCIDYRALNAVTKKEAGSLPRIDELFDQLHGARFFTSWDMSSAYHQTPIHPDDIHKTSFVTRYGQFEFTVLPFGLTNAPASFQRLMNEIFKPYLDKFVVIFLDDICVYSKTEEEHLRHIQLVLEKLDEYNLKMKISKCSFGQRSVVFLGHIISAVGLHVDSKKIAAVADWPLPHDLWRLDSLRVHSSASLASTDASSVTTPRLLHLRPHQDYGPLPVNATTGSHRRLQHPQNRPHHRSGAGSRPRHSQDWP